MEVTSVNPETLLSDTWKRVAIASESLAKIPDDSFVMNAKRGEGKTIEFEEQTELLALGWRMIGNGQIPEGQTPNDLLASFENKSRLKFYLTYKALTDVYETDQEGVLKFEPVKREWRETLTEVLLEEVDKLDTMDEKEQLGRLEIFDELSTRWMANVDLISIERLLLDNPENAEKSIGESYLTLDEIEKVGQRLLEKSTGVEVLFGSPEKKLKWKIIGRNFDKLWNRRKDNEALVDDFLKKIQ